MIIRYEGRSVTLKKVTPETLKEVIEAANLDTELQAARIAMVKESANGSSLALRRLRKKVKRLEERSTQ